MSVEDTMSRFTLAIERASAPERIRTKFQKIFNEKEAQEVLEVLSKRCGLGHGVFEPDPHKLYHREGQRDMLLFIFKMSGIGVDAFLKRKHNQIEEQRMI